MKLWVKICGIRDLPALRAAVQAGADALGFVLAESPRRLSIMEARDLIEAVPPGVERVAVFRRPGLDEVHQALDALDVSTVQVHGNWKMFLGQLGGCALLPAVKADELAMCREDFAGAADASGRCIIDSPGGEGSGQTWDFTAARDAMPGVKNILAGGLNSANLHAALEAARPWGVDVSSGVESAPGVKDPELIRRFIAECRALEDRL